MKKYFASFLLKLLGWSTEKKLPAEKKYVVIAAPHTSNWDFLYFILFSWTTGLKIHWIAKHTLFKGPFNEIFRWMVGIPINRQIRSNSIQQIVDEFNKHDNYVLTIAPEGTRSKVQYWKTGFYHIARQAKVPIAIGFINYEKKIVGIANAFYPSESLEDDMRKIKIFYQDKIGKHPSRQSEIKLKESN